jgi:hypothetical protein
MKQLRVTAMVSGMWQQLIMFLSRGIFVPVSLLNSSIFLSFGITREIGHHVERYSTDNRHL